MLTPPSTSQPLSWSERWHRILASLGFDLQRGRSLLRRGSLQEMTLQPGVIRAVLEDPDRGTCQVEITLPVLRDEAWMRILDALSGQALFVAQLLAGELPEAVDEHFQAEEVSLLPTTADELELACSCCAAWELPCKHINAALYAVGQTLDEDPWALFRLRGRNRQQVLQSLRRARSAGAAPLSSPTESHSEKEPSNFKGLGHDAAGPPLSSLIDEFWGKGRKLDRLHHTIAPPQVRLALLRRLGPPPFEHDSLEVYDALARIYEAVSQAALDLAFAPEPEEGEGKIED